MKQIILMAMLLPTLCFGQNTDSLSMPVLEGKVGIQKVVTIDSVTAKELFQRTRLYFAEKYRSAKDVVQLEDAEQGVIIGKGITKVTVSAFLATVDIEMRFMLRVEVKDNRYRYTINGVTTKGDDWTPIEEWWRYPKLNKKQRALFGEELHAVAAQLEEYMKKPSISKTDKW